jgi:hypothetical protein
MAYSGQAFPVAEFAIAALLLGPIVVGSLTAFAKCDPDSSTYDACKKSKSDGLKLLLGGLLFDAILIGAFIYFITSK